MSGMLNGLKDLLSDKSQSPYGHHRTYSSERARSPYRTYSPPPSGYRSHSPYGYSEGGGGYSGYGGYGRSYEEPYWQYARQGAHGSQSQYGNEAYYGGGGHRHNHHHSSSQYGYPLGASPSHNSHHSTTSSHHRTHSGSYLNSSSGNPIFKISEDVHRFMKQMLPDMQRETTSALNVIFYRYEHGSFENPNGYVIDTTQDNKKLQAVTAIVVVPYDPIAQYACCEDADFDHGLHYPVDTCVRHHKVESVILTNFDSWVFLHKRDTSERHQHKHTYEIVENRKPGLFRSNSSHLVERWTGDDYESSASENGLRRHQSSRSRSRSRHGGKHFRVIGTAGRLRDRRDEVPELLIDDVRRAYQHKLIKYNNEYYSGHHHHHRSGSRGRVPVRNDGLLHPTGHYSGATVVAGVSPSRARSTSRHSRHKFKTTSSLGGGGMYYRKV